MFEIYIDGSFITIADSVEDADLKTDAYIQYFLRGEKVKRIEYRYTGGVK
ncbi:hypothetical protein [Bacillus cereus]|uniref:Phage protein n=1 Tax=Bacillus cereus TIAC219 TaxID=718222 RepID=A0ABC9SQP1_BACCE|nr:hypothetical protein [Bacillus cereus]EJP81082.1 hypothetical protein IC1_06663 [Bacillus cereus VD022]EOQ57887.1 hypothetical protein IAY_06199 [Bacillus cereus TIAC219]